MAGCDFNSDGTDDIIASPGLGKRAEVRVFNGVTGLPFPPPLGSFLAFETGFLGGVHLACGDLTGDSIPDIIAARGALARPQVRVFNGVTAAPLPPPFGSFLAFNQTFFGGVRVAGCDLNQDGKTDIVAARGPLAQPEIRAFDGLTGNVFPPPLGSFLAFSASDRGGVYVACGDLTGDTIPDIIAGKGLGQPPVVRVFNGVTAAPLPPPFGSFQAFNSTFPGGVRVASCDLNQDGRNDIIAGRGPGAQPEVRAFDGVSGAPFPGPLGSFSAFAASFKGGVYVACSPNESGGGGPPPVDTAPEVTSTVPTDAATGVTTNSNLTITFNEPVAVTGDWFQVSCPTSGPRNVTLANTVVTGGPTTWTINPNTDFAPNEICSTTIVAAQVTDVDGNDPPNEMAADFTFGFTTDAAPSVSSTVPSNGATGVAVGSNITVTFSESVATTASTFGLECPAGTPVPFVVSPAPPGNTTSYTLNPNADLPEGSCTIKVTATQVTDVDTNDPPDTMVTDFTSTFTSGANDPPAPSGGPFSIPENSANGTPVGTVAANDPDAGQTHTFAITGGNTGGAFAINSSTGAITVNNSAALDFETMPSFSLTVEATDDASPPLSGSTTVTINVTDVNENQAPAPSGGPFSLPENSANATPVGTVAANDPDAGQTHTFAIIGANTGGAFAINSSGQITVANMAALDFETTPSFSLTVQVTDNGSPPLSGTTTVVVNLTNVNEAPVATAKSHQTHSGIRITIGAGDTGQLKEGATDVDDPFGDLSVSATFSASTPPGATIVLTDPATGTFTFNPPAGFSGLITFQFQVCDDGAPTPPAMCSAPATVSVNVTGPDLWFVNNTVAVGGTGRLTDPFSTLASLPAGRGNGDRIFVFSGAGAYGTGHTLFVNEHLIGQGSSGAFDTVLGVTVPGNGTLDTRPALGGTRPQLNGTVTVGSSSTVRGLNIASTTATGLSGGAVAGVSVSEASVTSTTGTAVNLNSTGGAFSLTAVSANGAANGILLNNTIGSFTVTGTGAAGTGGTIQNTTGDGILLTTSAQGVSLSFMNVVNNLGNGIRGNNVTGFTLASSTVDNNDSNNNGAAADEAGFHFTNLVGTASITSTTVSNHPEDNARILNSSGTLSQLTITNSTFRDTDTASPGNNGLLIQGDSSASITGDINSSSFLRNRANGVQVINNGSGMVDVEVGTTAACTFQDNNVGANIAHNGAGSLAFDVFNSSFSAPTLSTAASPINLNKATAGTGTMSGTVSGNVITNANSASGPGIRVNGNGVGGTLTTLIQSNNISQVANRGIEVVARDGNNTLNATVTNNTVQLTDPLSISGIYMEAGTVAADATTICAAISGNDADTVAGEHGIRLQNIRAGTTFRLPSYGGPATDADGEHDLVVAHLAGLNPATPAIRARHLIGNSGFNPGGAACPTP